MDIRTITANGFDWQIAGPGLAEEDGLETAIIISLFTDRRANHDDILPATDDDRRGWWGDYLADTAGDLIGSRLWLLEREKLTDAVLLKAKEIAAESLQWLIEDGVARAVTVTAERLQATALGLLIEITKPDGSVVSYQFSRFWQGELYAV